MDDIDRAIVGILVRNARATFAEIGAEVNLSAPAVKRRVDRLLATGAIRSFTTVVDPKALGWHTEAYVHLYCRGTVAPKELQRVFERMPEVVGAATITGSAYAVLHVLAADVRHLEEALDEIRNQPNIERTESAIVLSRLIQREHP